MYLANKSFYQTYFAHLPSTELFQIFQTLDQLFQRYGRYQLTHPDTLQVIQQHSPLLFTLLTFLIQHKKCTRKDVKTFKHLVQTQAKSEHPHFTITSPSEKMNTQLEKQFKKQFKQADFSLVSSSDIALQVRGGELRYERNLEKDLRKMFKT